MKSKNTWNIWTIFFLKCMTSIAITLVILILIKANINFKDKFYKEIYSKNISFAYINNLYKKYIGDIDLLNKVTNVEPVFHEQLTYISKTDYLDGVSLEVDKNYLVPISESGIVVFIGPKDGYGNVVIIQRFDGIDEWYGNLDSINVKLYDYVKKGSFLGEANGTLYLVYKKDGNVLNYEKYIN